MRVVVPANNVTGSLRTMLVTAGLVDNVSFLSATSGRLLEFVNGKVIGDYKGMTELLNRMVASFKV